jgi:hypothetical protein
MPVFGGFEGGKEGRGKGNWVSIGEVDMDAPKKNKEGGWGVEKRVGVGVKRGGGGTGSKRKQKIKIKTHPRPSPKYA